MKKTIQEHITLLSPTVKIFVPIQVNYDDGEDTVNTVEINLTYNGVLYQGKGADYLWVDAFADLQNKLPYDTKLACCMTCRHGNMCPYGNKENQLFCTKDVIIASKDDMIELIDNTDLFVERAVSSIQYCDSFSYQSDDYYTYNDYLYYLKKDLNSYVKTYVAKTDELWSDEVFARYYDTVPTWRKEKIDRLRRQEERVRSLAAELLLRRALADVGVTQYTVGCGENGKPYLVDHPSVFFNLSHAGGVVMCAVSDRKVGCDVEKIVPGREALANRFFTAGEAAHINAQPTDEQKTALFFRYWTLKESFMKVTGRGMSLSPAAFEIELSADGIRIAHDVDGETYHAREFSLLDGYHFAVCACHDSFSPPQWVTLAE